MGEQNNTTPAPRLPLEMDVEFRRSYAREATAGVLKNISMTGAFLETATLDLQSKDKIVVTLMVSGRRRNVTARVIWKNQRGFGLQFQPFNNRDVQIVDDLIYFVENNRENRRSIFDDILKRVG